MLVKPTNYFNLSGIHNCDSYCNCIVQMINNSANSKSGSNTGCVRIKAVEEVCKLMVMEDVSQLNNRWRCVKHNLFTFLLFCSEKDNIFMSIWNEMERRGLTWKKRKKMEMSRFCPFIFNKSFTNLRLFLWIFQVCTSIQSRFEKSGYSGFWIWTWSKVAYMLEKRWNVPLLHFHK